MNFNKYKEYAPILLRIGISLFFLWFGLTQLINPEYFFGYVPFSLSDNSLQIILINGIFEASLGLLLLLGLFTRLSSFLLGLHLFGITLSLGYNDLAVRDFALTLATFAVFLNGQDKWCLDKKTWR